MSPTPRYVSALRYRNQGFSLVEILLVMAIIILISIAAFVILLQVNEASDANTESQNLTTVIAGVRNLYGRQANYVGLDNGVANLARIFPRSMNDGVYAATQPIRHLAHGAVDVIPWDADSRRFAIIYRDVPTSLCVKIAQNYGKNVDEVLVDGVHVKNLGDSGSDPEDTIMECNRNPLTDITFVQK